VTIRVCGFFSFYKEAFDIIHEKEEPINSGFRRHAFLVAEKRGRRGTMDFLSSIIHRPGNEEKDKNSMDCYHDLT
jgi:hypothetical protein